MSTRLAKNPARAIKTATVINFAMVCILGESCDFFLLLNTNYGETDEVVRYHYCWGADRGLTVNGLLYLFIVMGLSYSCVTGFSNRKKDILQSP